MRKNKKDDWMPPRVYRGKSAYEYRPKSGKCIKLGKLSLSKTDVWQAYEKVKVSETNKNTINYLIDGYINDYHFQHEIKPATQKDYLGCKKRVSEVFGQMRYIDLEPMHVKAALRIRGKQSKHRANRERTFLYNVMAWGCEEGLISKNPCKGVKPYKLTHRKRYVTDKEYDSVYKIAPDTLKAVMEIAYLCAARSGDIRKLMLNHIKGEGLYICQSKTGKEQIKRWTPRLKKAVELGKSRPSRITSTYIIHNRHGQPYTASGLKCVFGKVITKAMDDGLIEERFSLHDLKAKGISDFEGDKQTFSGHKSKVMMEKYNRTADIVDIVDPKSSENGSE